MPGCPPEPRRCTARHPDPQTPPCPESVRRQPLPARQSRQIRRSTSIDREEQVSPIRQPIALQPVAHNVVEILLICCSSIRNPDNSEITAAVNRAGTEPADPLRFMNE